MKTFMERLAHFWHSLFETSDDTSPTEMDCSISYCPAGFNKADRPS